MGTHPIVPENLDLLYEYSGDVWSIDLVGSHAAIQVAKGQTLDF